jgi:hypothetical protein
MRKIFLTFVAVMLVALVAVFLDYAVAVTDAPPDLSAY